MEENDLKETNENLKKESGLISKNSKIILAVIIALFVFFIGFIIAIVPSDTQDSSGDEGKQDVKIYEHVLGEKFNFDGIDYEITSYEIKPWYDTYEPSNSNNQYLIIYLNLYNPTNSTKNLVDNGWFTTSHLYIYDLYCDGSEYNTSYGYGSDFILNNESLMASERIEGVLMFEAPKDKLINSQEIKLEITFNKIADQDEFHVVKLKNK